MKTLEVDESKYVREAFPIQHEFELIKRKGVYPHDYMDSFPRFDELSTTFAGCILQQVVFFFYKDFFPDI